MKTYRVKLTYLYSKTVDVQAPDKATAIQLAEQDEDEVEEYESHYDNEVVDSWEEDTDE